jgi:hypothetical protein
MNKQTNRMRIKEVWSGGQTGADMGGLLAAEKFGIKTGGWCMPYGWNETGRHPDYIKRFGFSPVTGFGKSSLNRRTILNVRDTDATIIIAKDFNSPGTKLTIWAAHDRRKPVWRVSYAESGKSERTADNLKDEIDSWLNLHPDLTVEKINIAGNRESKAPGIQAFTKLLIEYLMRREQEVGKS